PLRKMGLGAGTDAATLADQKGFSLPIRWYQSRGRKVRVHWDGFTLIEMLVVMAIIAILAAMLLPAVVQSKSRAHQIACVSNLKQVGVAYQNFVNDHDGRFPMDVSVRDGGMAEHLLTLECCTNAFLTLQVLSNELVTP